MGYEGGSFWSSFEFVFDGIEDCPILRMLH